jgi:hypothetical protein
MAIGAEQLTKTDELNQIQALSGRRSCLLARFTTRKKRTANKGGKKVNKMERYNRVVSSCQNVGPALITRNASPLFCTKSLTCGLYITSILLPFG